MTPTDDLAARVGQLGHDVLGHVGGLLLDPMQRTYWVGLLASAVVVLVFAVRRGRSPVRGRQFWGRSARVDYGLILVKPLIAAVFVLPWTLTTVQVAMAVLRALRAVGEPALLADALPGWLVMGAYTLALFVAWDLSRFVLHALMHRSAVLWQFHQVHHSAQTLSPLTLYRVHPVESALYALRGVLVTGAVLGVFTFAFGDGTVQFELLGVNALGLLCSVVSGNLRHSHLWWSFGRFERWLISPAQHQLHHGTGPEDCRANYGTWLSVWDRLAGSWRPAEQPPDAFGLPPTARNHRPESLLSALIDPVSAAVRQVVRVRWALPAGAGVLAALWSVLGRAQPAPAQSAPDDEIDVDLSDLDPDGEAPGEEDPDVDADLSDFDPDAPADPVPLDPRPTDADAPADDGAADDDVDISTPTVSIIGEPEELPRVVGSAHTVDEETLEREEHDDIHRVLRTIPGVYVRGEDGYGLRPNIGLRGADPNRSAKVTLMEDGVLFGPAPYSAPAAYYFPMTTRLTGVEVFKGPAAVRFGPNTVGGAINVKTREIPRDLKTGVDVAAGTWGYGKLHGYAGKSWKRFGILAEGARIRTSGFKDLDGGGDTGFRKNEFMVKSRLHGDPGARVYQQFDVKLGLSTEVSNETYLGLTEADFDADPFRRYRASKLDRMDWYRTQVQAGYFLASGIVEFQSTVYRHDFSRAWTKFNGFSSDLAPEPYAFFQDPEGGTNGLFLAVLRGEVDSSGPEEFLRIGTNQRDFVSQGWQNTVRISPQTKHVDQVIEVGARLHADRISRLQDDDDFAMVAGSPVLVEGTRRITTANRGEAFAASFHAVDEIRIVDRFTLSPGARVEVIRTAFTDSLVAPGEEVTSLDTVFLPGLGLHVQATKWLGVLGGVHSGFSPKAPGQGDAVDPERSINAEAGLRAAHEGFRAEAIGYLNDYSNLVTNCTVSQGCDDAELDEQFSGGEVLVAGSEALAGYRADLGGPGWIDTTATYTYTWSRFGSSFVSASPFLGQVEAGDAVPYVPVHVASLQFAGGMRRWFAHAQLLYNGQMRDVPGQGRIPANERIDRFVTLDLGGNVFITRRAQLYLNIGNATRAGYAVSRRPFGLRPGRRFSVIGGFKHNFG